MAHNPPRKLGDYVMPGPYKEAALRLHEMAQSQQGLVLRAEGLEPSWAV